ncbi:60 kDa lysophospholipase isoform X6 [Leopardus geoffroyi]|uniref:60 kDa lysophospholipase isoform X6 n=1 Tax=Leopardus geoffroyi TaxID=46844 RepID=UPI001E260153|nr:60 kDa lysophospholipase isoform X6 [Leopardus geoffroyi]
MGSCAGCGAPEGSKAGPAAQPLPLPPGFGRHLPAWSWQSSDFGPAGRRAFWAAPLCVNRELVRKVRGKERLVVHSSVERDVGLLRLYPGIPAALVRAFLQPPLRGVVMETFGCGNGPTKPDLLQEFRAATERGLLIVNCTHCLQGTVTSGYAAGMAVAGAGIVSGFDMTSEAAMAKLSYVLGQPGLSLDSRKQLLARDLRGEVTLPAGDEHQPSLTCSTLGRGVAQLLSLSQEADAVREALTPGLACAAAHAGDLDVLQALVELGSDLSQENFNGQTPLHAAARGGHPEVVTMLLQRGVGVSARDEDGLSPLLLAVKGRHQDVIGLLRAAGACLSPQELEDAGTELCRPLCDAPYQSTGGPRPWPRGSWSLEGTSDPSTACPATLPHPTGQEAPTCLPPHTPSPHSVIWPSRRLSSLAGFAQVLGSLPGKGLVCLPCPHTPPVPREEVSRDLRFSGSAAWCLT